MGIEERSSTHISLRDALRKTKERNKALEEKLGQTEALLKEKANGQQKRMLFSVILLVFLLFLASKLAA